MPSNKHIYFKRKEFVDFSLVTFQCLETTLDSHFTKQFYSTQLAKFHALSFESLFQQQGTNIL